MSDSEQPETETAVSQPQWPENGGQWSDEEGGAGMDECGLAEMAEEDEEIDIYNNETFGMEVVDTEGDPTNPLFQFGEKPPALPALPSLSPSSPPFSPRARPQLRVQGPPGRRGRGQRGGQAMAQMFEDPAVVRTVEGRPSLQVITIARSIVSTCREMLFSSYVGVSCNGDVLFTQVGGLPSPRPCPSTPQPLTPKMMQLRFGANSPRPSPFYSPSSNRVQRFRFPGPVTQLHPQHRRLLSQRQQRSQRKPDSWDPYCNLMSAKEKEWIIRLQMIQLQSENPHLDDYYYQEYYRRMEAKLAEEELGMRGKREPPKLTTPYVTKMDSYTPVVHIEGSLGQVAVSTCFSPRRAINAVAAHCPHEELKDIRQQRLDVLKKIEKVKYSKWHLQGVEAEEEFLPCLLVSKGKQLLARLLPFLSHDAALKVLSMVTSHLPVLMSRDSDESLPVLYPSLRIVIGGMTFSQLIGVLKDFTASLPDSSDGSVCLSLVCQSKFGLSLLYALLSQGERLLSSDVPLEPSIGDFETWTDTVFLVASQLSQSALVEPLLLPSNLLTLFCRYLDKRTIHQLKSNMESATGYLALPS
uniref:mRNA decay factor PAT1 domain-containing protein n=1 Tax=Oncorhynchus tshawytscha TaxID=74940 RepID=A0A8C8CFU3_ONCTS